MRPKPLIAQVSAVNFALWCAFAPAIVLLIFIYWLSETQNLSIGVFTRDISSIAKLPFYTGALSTIGIILWSVASSVCLLTAAALFRKPSVDRKAIWFLVYAGLFTSLLLFDDAFLLHEAIAPRHLGIPDTILMLIYGVLAALFVLFFASNILHSNYSIFVLSILLLAFSVLFDIFDDKGYLLQFGIENERMKHIYEDGFKLLGIFGWCAYLVITSYEMLVEQFVNKS